MSRSKRAPRVVTWLAFGLGTSVSVTLNGFYAAAISDSPVPVVIGMTWPLMAAIAVDLMTRVPFPKGRAWTLARLGGVGLVAAGAMVVSYLHARHVLLWWGNDAVTALVAPLVVDGLMTLSGAALLAMHTPAPTPARRRTPATRKPQLKAA